MSDYERRVILNQRYVHKEDGTKASLLELSGDDAIIETEHGYVEKISLEYFKLLFILKLSF